MNIGSCGQEGCHIHRGLQEVGKLMRRSTWPRKGVEEEMGVEEWTLRFYKSDGSSQNKEQRLSNVSGVREATDTRERAKFRREEDAKGRGRHRQPPPPLAC